MLDSTPVEVHCHACGRVVAVRQSGALSVKRGRRVDIGGRVVKVWCSHRHPSGQGVCLALNTIDISVRRVEAAVA